MPTRRLATAIAVLAAAGGLTACGNKEDKVTFASTEGVYVNVGPLQYQVQISRQLNPNSVSDKGYLVDLSPQDRRLPGNQIFFAVFVQVANASHKTDTTATDFKIRDTLGDVYTPLPFGPKNVFAYRPMTLGHDDMLPAPDSAAYEGSTVGELLLFKLPEATLDNRPLQLQISKPGEDPARATVNLDV
jgi:hypothetical protein